MAEPKIFNLGEIRQKAFSDIEHIIQNKINDKFDILLLILPKIFRSYYNKIKQACTINNSIIS